MLAEKQVLIEINKLCKRISEEVIHEKNMEYRRIHIGFRTTGEH